MTGSLDELSDLRGTRPRHMRHLSWAGLPHVRTVRSKGRTYLYFNVSRAGRRYVRLPDPETTDFAAVYRALYDARQGGEGDQLLAQRALRDHRSKRRFVYFVGGDQGAIKIGFAKSPDDRLREIQVGSPIPLSILALVEGGPKLEKGYHRRFAAHRLHGEWFAPHPDILAEIERLTPKRPEHDRA